MKQPIRRGARPNVPARSSQSLRPKQSLGQNFLRDENISRKIVASLNACRDDVILEIGPGEAALTKYLAPQLNKLIVVDVDERVIGKMHELFSDDAVEVLHQDVLETDFATILQQRNASKLRIIGNIPYNITSPILFHVIDNRSQVSDATLMMQKEVARRLIANPSTKDYGILAVFCQLFADVELLFDVSPKCFYPEPKVTSSVVRLTFLDSPRFALHSEVFFRTMVRSVFGKRRKTLRNSLGYMFDPLPPRAAEFDLTKRPEQLTIAQLVELANGLTPAMT
jgi:16S rRNA (adenine1518-N6/adenine1519-N6)-dimethyltransferase